MTNTLELRMPVGYMDMSAEEMEYLEGGGTITVVFKKAFLKAAVGLSCKTIGGIVGARYGGTIGSKAGKVLGSIVGAYLAHRFVKSDLKVTFTMSGLKTRKVTLYG